MIIRAGAINRSRSCLVKNNERKKSVSHRKLVQKASSSTDPGQYECPTPRRAAAAAAAQSGKPKQRKPTPQSRQHPSPDPKSSEAEASSSSAPPPTTRTASTSKAKLSSDSLLTGAATISAPIKRKDATAVNRRSVDFSKIVLEAARRASNTTVTTTGNNRRGTTDSSDIEAAGAGAGINFEKIIRDRKSKLLHRQPSIEEVAETESTVSIGSAFNLAKQHSLNSPRRRR
uniref:Uncharacterized protein n=1 Tax=Panagrolaimus davidi TaxID=227884 RepID=A0A914P4P7_9BILA